MTRAPLPGPMPEDAIPGSRVRATTKHGTLSVDDLADVQPGMARLMDELSHRYWVLYYAAEAGNWELARYMERESEKLLGIMGKVRPTYAADLAAFVAERMAPLAAAIEARDFAAFDAAARRGIDASDAYHAKYAKGFIRFRIPDHPPEWFDLAPR